LGQYFGSLLMLSPATSWFFHIAVMRHAKSPRSNTENPSFHFPPSRRRDLIPGAIIIAGRLKHGIDYCAVMRCGRVNRSRPAYLFSRIMHVSF
jgi:hypothetical protein